jgi:hypothetical protein
MGMWVSLRTSPGRGVAGRVYATAVGPGQAWPMTSCRRADLPGSAGVSERSRSQRCVERVDDAECVRVYWDSGMHLVHGVAEADVCVGVGEADRALGAGASGGRGAG